jgi:hypothetical protein
MNEGAERLRENGDEASIGRRTGFAPALSARSAS